MAWQPEQAASKVACVAWKWVLSKNGTTWFAADGPLGWQARVCTRAFVKFAEKQLGAPGNGPAPGPVTR